MGKVYGYVRVSTKDQHEDRQIVAMHAAGLSDEDIIIEKKSGKNFEERENYQTLKKFMRSGDTLVVMSLDRLGRNYQQIKSEWVELCERGIGIRVLDMPMLDTSADRDLTGRFIADLVLQILSYTAEKEYHSIKERQRQGIEAAHAKGIKFGRKPVPVPDGFEDIVRRWRVTKEITFKEAQALSGLTRSMFYIHAKAMFRENENVKENQNDNQ